MSTYQSKHTQQKQQRNQQQSQQQQPPNKGDKMIKRVAMRHVRRGLTVKGARRVRTAWRLRKGI